MILSHGIKDPFWTVTSTNTVYVKTMGVRRDIDRPHLLLN